MTTTLARRSAPARSALLGAAIGLAFAAAPAAAQDASVYVSVIDVSTSNGEMLTWSDPYQSLSASALSGGGLGGADTDDDTTDAYAATIGFATTPNASVTYAAPGDQTFSLTATTTPGNYPLGTPRSAAEALGSTSGSFSLTEAATVTFTVFYQLAANKPGGNPISDFAAAFLNFSLSGGQSGGGSVSDSLESFAEASGMAMRSGRFSLTVSLLANQLAFYSLDGRAESFASAVTPIPEPETWALMMAGLAGLGVVARRRRSAATA